MVIQCGKLCLHKCTGTERTALRAALPTETGKERVGDARERVVHADAVHRFHACRPHVRQRAAPAHIRAGLAAGHLVKLKLGSNLQEPHDRA